mgnify:CR=1 FL=1
MSRCYNFCAGPAALPEAVLEIARDDMLEWHGKGLSLMEMSHRSPEVVGVAEHAEQTLRKLLGISDDYAVLFLQGGASTQFAAAPLNLLGDKAGADYVNTGQWSKNSKKCSNESTTSNDAHGWSTSSATEPADHPICA